MSLKQKVRLELDDDREIVVEYSAIDLRAWESKFNRSALMEDMSVSMLTWLGWSAAVRTGLLDGQLKDWRTFNEACVSVEGAKDADPTTPGSTETSTPTTPGDGSSAP